MPTKMTDNSGPEILPRPKRTALTDLYQTPEFRRAWTAETKPPEPMTPEQWIVLRNAFEVFAAASPSASSAIGVEYAHLAQTAAAYTPAILEYRKRVQAELDKLYDLRRIDLDIIADLEEQIECLRSEPG